ncbi:hypothetical protein ACIRRA_25930 [Nocardia sp. NPDC101769]|uniref:hypothetical protein n=1 Tax=Nocardia sp. NPDC101769 TaxID=3364333 RepID=UPI00382975C9
MTERFCKEHERTGHVAFPIVHIANKNRAVPITEKDFHYAFTNNLTDEDSKAVYDRYSVPVSGRILFQGGFANFTPSTLERSRRTNCSPAAATTPAVRTDGKQSPISHSTGHSHPNPEISTGTDHHRADRFRRAGCARPSPENSMEHHRHERALAADRIAA